MGRTTLTVTDDAHDAAEPVKDELDMSWSQFLEAAADALDGADEHGPNTVAVENVDEIARASAQAVEDRLPGR